MINGMQPFHVKGDLMKKLCIKILMIFCLYSPVMFCMEDPHWQKVRFMKRVLTFIKGSYSEVDTIQPLLYQLSIGKLENSIPERVFCMQDDNGDNLLHLLARIGNHALFKEAVDLDIPRNITNLKSQTVVDVLNEQIVEARRAVDTDKLNALGQCLATYKSVYLKSFYCLVPVDE